MKKIFIAFVFLSAKIAVAQTAATNTGILYITGSSDIFYAGSDLTNNSGSDLTNNGQLYIKGNLSNAQASMPAGTGTLYLNGTIAQLVSGSQIFKTNNLVTDNTTGITLNNNLSVAGLHTYTNGLIATSVTPNYLVYEAGSSHTGTADSRHVTGWVKKYGTTNFTFPVGDASYLRTAAITNLSVTGEFNCQYLRPTQNISSVTNPVKQVKANEYWQINKIAGGTARVTLNWEHSKVPMNNVLLTDVVVAQYTGGFWTDAGGSPGATGNVTTTGSVISNAITTFSPFTIGLKTFPVPLQLVSFTAERRAGTSYLKWVTDNEQNVDHFDVQRSYDALNFSTIGNLSARNSGAQEHYIFEDHSPMNGFAYYRIRSVDIDRKTSYTKIAVVSEKVLPANSFAVLNPVRDAITVFNKTGDAGSFDYRLFNSSGQLCLKGNIYMTNNGGTVLPLPSQTAAGIYILEMSNDRTQFRQKIQIEK